MSENRKNALETAELPPKGRKHTIFLETYGCQMNEYDTELVKAILSKQEYALTKDEMEADVIMLNTCAIRENAHRKVYGRIHEIKHKRAQGSGVGGQKDVKIGILGCMATNLRTDLLENRSLDIDFIAGPDSYKRLPQLIEEAFRDQGSGARGQGSKPFDLTLSEYETYSDIHPGLQEGVNAWVAVMRGCNNFCTFCVVPYTRGRERSRSVENVVAEIKQLAAQGFRQVTLLGQNVNSYYHEGKDFADLMEAVSAVAGIERIRFTSPHPKDFPDKFLKVMAGKENICKHIHLPLQSGSDAVLERMDRTYTQAEFLALVEKIRATIPGVALSTDVIVGFCGETDADFEETCKVMEQVEFDAAFIFKYSERKNTIAARKLKDDVPDAIKTERIVRLNELQKNITFMKNRAHEGRVFRALIENEGSSKSDDIFIARLDNNRLVKIPSGAYKRGDFVDVRITRATPFDLRGECAALSIHA